MCQACTRTDVVITSLENGDMELGINGQTVTAALGFEDEVDHFGNPTFVIEFLSGECAHEFAHVSLDPSGQWYLVRNAELDFFNQCVAADDSELVDPDAPVTYSSQNPFEELLRNSRRVTWGKEATHRPPERGHNVQ